MKINISIEARMTSSRLPGKVLLPIRGIPSLEIMIHRVTKSKLADNIIVATTINKEDEPIVNWCKNHNINYFRGSENNVYERVLQTHEHFHSDVIVELTGDCPLLDGILIDEAIDIFLKNKYDYVSNGLEMTYPLGMAVQVYTLKTLQSIKKNRELEYQDMEHVTPYLYTSGKYSTYNIRASKQHHMPELSVTLDTIEDFQVIENVVTHFPDLDFSLEDIINFAKQNPQKVAINKNIHRKGLS
ncbi:MAG: glycosyltransferase family protein [Campylobacterales bacterium]|nr:glycosyltransferase family protein [Campylobacterales bacterium]